ncbi:MAG TPA: hypothetical protein VJU59_51150, partial [Paraburkholderia sp.]|nr:hypothetical protein [Paraburkholderia sp.]
MPLAIRTAQQRKSRIKPSTPRRSRATQRASLAAAACALAALAPRAEAQTPSPLGEWQYSAGIPLEKMFQPNRPDFEAR